MFRKAYMNRQARLAALALLALLLGTAGSAQAEMNLWISRHFMGIATYDQGQYQEALGVLEAALNETGSKHRHAATLDQLGQLHTALGRFDEAESYYKRALDEKESSLGKKHRDLAETLNNLADLYYLSGKADRCEGLYRRALEINKRDQLNIQVCRSLNGLALLENDASDKIEAEKFLQRAIKIHQKAERRDQPYYATVLTNLGILYTNNGRYDEAAPLFEKAEFVQKQSLRGDHPDVALRMHATAALLQAQGKNNEAATLAAQADEIRAKQTAAGNLY